MIYKKLVSLLIVLFFAENLFSISFEELIYFTLESNSDIKTSQLAYEKGKLSTKFSDGSYSPELILSTSMTIPKKYKWNTLPDYYASGITYAQPLPGGANLSFNTSYSFDSYILQEQIFLSQTPNISFSLSQSLLPFWAQGTIQDPVKLSLKQKEEYLYYQFLYAKKNVLLNLFQNYVYALITLNEISIYQNIIALYEKQIETFNELKASGNISQSKILEIENSKWNTQQSLMNTQTQYIEHLQIIESICGKNLDGETLADIIDNNSISILFDIIDSANDPLEQTYKLKLALLKSTRILDKQSYAPVITFSVQPKLSLPVTKEDDWKTAWEDFPNSASWNLSIGLNLSPIFSDIAKQNNNLYKLDYEDTNRSYNEYLKQKNFVKQQYKTLLEHYINQNETVSLLYESSLKEFNDFKQQYEVAAISQLDFESVRIQKENIQLTKECVNLYICLYDMLIKIN